MSLSRHYSSRMAQLPKSEFCWILHLAHSELQGTTLMESSKSRKMLLSFWLNLITDPNLSILSRISLLWAYGCSKGATVTLTNWLDWNSLHWRPVLEAYYPPFIHPNSYLNFLRNCRTVFHRACIILPFLPQCTRDLNSPLFIKTYYYFLKNTSHPRDRHWPTG